MKPGHTLNVNALQRLKFSAEIKAESGDSDVKLIFGELRLLIVGCS